MRALLRRCLRHHTAAVAYVALFAALGGSAYAGAALKRNSVRSVHIAKGQVKRSDVRSNAIDSLRVKDGSLVAADFAPGTLTAGPAGPIGPAGPPGEEGEPGATGPPGLSGVEGCWPRRPTTRARGKRSLRPAPTASA